MTETVKEGFFGKLVALAKKFLVTRLSYSLTNNVGLKKMPKHAVWATLGQLERVNI